MMGEGGTFDAIIGSSPLFDFAEGNEKSERFPDEEKVRIILIWWTI